MEVLSRYGQHWQAAWQHSRFSQPWLAGLLGITLVLGGLVVYAGWTQQQLNHDLQALPVSVAGVHRQLPVPQPDQTALAMHQIRHWPLTEDADRISAGILAQADVLGMVFERAEFQTVAGEQAYLQVQRIKLPLKAEYPQLRQFLQQVLHDYPSLAISQCKLQRSDALQTGIEADVELSLYTRKREAD